MEEQKVYVMDGAIGSYLQLLYAAVCQKKRVDYRYADFLQFDHFDLMQQVHSEYIYAGADILKTGTCNLGNRSKLSLSSITEKATRYGQIANQVVVNNSKVVWGAIGPIYEPSAALRFDRYRAIIDGLLLGGISIFYFETICHLYQLQEIKKLYEEYASTEIKLHISLTPKEDSENQILSGEPFTAACEILKDIPTQSVGLNCFSILHTPVIDKMLHQMHAATQKSLSLNPSLGIPHKGIYPRSKEETLEALHTLLTDCYLRYVGGCCGIHPDFIEKLSKHKKY